MQVYLFTIHRLLVMLITVGSKVFLAFQAVLGIPTFFADQNPLFQFYKNPDAEPNSTVHSSKAQLPACR